MDRIFLTAVLYCGFQASKHGAEDIVAIFVDGYRLRGSELLLHIGKTTLDGAAEYISSIISFYITFFNTKTVTFHKQ